MNRGETEKERKKERVVWVYKKNLYVNKDGERGKERSKQRKEERTKDRKICINVLSVTAQYDYLCSRVFWFMT
jgi:hypothetical protein